MLKVLVSAAGEPESAEVNEADAAGSAQAIFADASISAVMQWRFNPGSSRRRSRSAGYVLIPFTYSLTDDDEDRRPPESKDNG